jgi:hypothetical protein
VSQRASAGASTNNHDAQETAKMKAAILLLFVSAVSTSACAVESQETSTMAQAVAGPSAHCVLCGGDDDPGGGGNGGGGLYGATVDFMDANYPGWSGSINCSPDSNPDGTPRGLACDVDFTWHSAPGYTTCEYLPDEPGVDHCGGTI